ncbi:hypothetical protein [Nocardiopsis sp. FIRDI 009]|uniref:hypothetical protein n=1 Tax=Nocardiopsis sp. FIRDI 009 TaxID=714197 RepID=UPI000E28A154|nr:hypothetical protein [Nocardiopsis sp. FIRDI 009]
MSSPSDNDEFENRLRSILRSEADACEPSPEGLNLIRERTERARGGWFGLPWLRPALAVAGAVLIAVSVVISNPEVRDQVLEIVPAGADREGTPPAAAPSEEDVASAEPVPDTGAGVAVPEPEPADDPSPTPTSSPGSSAPPEEATPTDECSPTRPTPSEEASPADEGSGEQTSDRTGADDCPTVDDEPTDEGTDGATDGAGGDGGDGGSEDAGGGDEPTDDSTSTGGTDGGTVAETPQG